MLGDIIVIAIIVLAVGLATAYIIKAKKSGKKCIGCPDSYACSSKNKGDTTQNACGGNCAGCGGACSKPKKQ